MYCINDFKFQLNSLFKMKFSSKENDKSYIYFFLGHCKTGDLKEDGVFHPGRRRTASCSARENTTRTQSPNPV